MRHVPPKHPLTCNGLHGGISQKTEFFTIIVIILFDFCEGLNTNLQILYTLNLLYVISKFHAVAIFVIVQ
jgi:hypothetical protein